MHNSIFDRKRHWTPAQQAHHICEEVEGASRFGAFFRGTMTRNPCINQQQNGLRRGKCVCWNGPDFDPTGLLWRDMKRSCSFKKSQKY